MYALSASCVSLLRALLCTWIVWLNCALMWMHCVDAFLARTQRNRFELVSNVVTPCPHVHSMHREADSRRRRNACRLATASG
jgi:hypothetical protein